jgi:hypothetical protein
VFDPLSVWWGLKASADDKSPGFAIAVFGGPKADIPITPAAGSSLGRLFAAEPIFRRIGYGRDAQKRSRRGWWLISWTIFSQLIASLCGGP